MQKKHQGERMQTPWEYRYAHRTSRMGSSVIRELLKLTQEPDIISFAGGLPAPEVFPVERENQPRQVGNLGLVRLFREGLWGKKELVRGAQNIGEAFPQTIYIPELKSRTQTNR